MKYIMRVTPFCTHSTGFAAYEPHSLPEFRSDLPFWLTILLTLKANGVFSEAPFAMGRFSSYLFKLSNLRLCLETAGCAGEC